MIVQQFFTKGLAHSSYLLGGTKRCAIVDPRRDIDIYIESAKAMDMKITHIFETHLHADFVSGHLDLAEATGAKIYTSKSADCKFDYVGLADGDTFEIDDMSINVLETPGHTPEHISYVVSDRNRGNDPVSVFTGDTLFVGDVGRPDLFPGRSYELASMLYDSLNDKLLKLPDFCEVYPAHGAGTLCGRAIGAKRTSTIGYERIYNSALQFKNRDEFIKSLTTDMPAAPDHFGRCSEINRQGPKLFSRLPNPQKTHPEIFNGKIKEEGSIILDIRSYDAFSGQHISGSYHIDLMSNFATFAGWLLPPNKNIMLVANSYEQSLEATTWLRRVGLDNVGECLVGGLFEWSRAGLPTSHVSLLSAQEVHEMATSGKNEMVLVDVRSPSEYEVYHIERAINIPLAELRSRYNELNPDMRTILTCSVGLRGSTGASILKQHGFKSVFNLAGGMAGYNSAGFAPECPMCYASHGSRFLGKKLEVRM